MTAITWNPSAIQLPKLNANLLAVISLILILTMAFLTASVIADHCQAVAEAVAAAEAKLTAAQLLLHLAEAARLAAILTGNAIAIALAEYAVKAARAKVASCLASLAVVLLALIACQQTSHGSGSCG